MRNSIIKVFMIFVMFAALWITAQAQTSVVQTKVNLTSAPAALITGQVLFSSDSLLQAKTNQIQVSPYAGYTACLSFYATSAGVRNFQVRSYLSNFLSSDTTYWTLSQSWDTTGIYLNKPINDTINITISGLPMTYISFLLKGLTGNREDVVLNYRIALFRKDG